MIIIIIIIIQIIIMIMIIRERSKIVCIEKKEVKKIVCLSVQIGSAIFLSTADCAGLAVKHIYSRLADAGAGQSLDEGVPDLLVGLIADRRSAIGPSALDRLQAELGRLTGGCDVWL